jgi:hypothetical protein
MHGMPDDDVAWTLSAAQNIQKLRQERLKDPKTPKPIVCPKCACVFQGRAICPACGHEFKTRPRERQYRNGKLVEVPNGTQHDHSLEAAQRYWTSCLYVMANKRRTAGAAAHMFHRKFGAWPWERTGLVNVPSRDDWKKNVTDLYPNFAR